jgi:hypothetical protein
MKTFLVDGVRLNGYINLNEIWTAEDLDDLAYKLQSEIASVGMDNFMEIEAEEITDDPNAEPQEGAQMLLIPREPSLG